MGEVRQLIGASLDVRPSEETANEEAWQFYDYTFTHPADGSETTGIALVVPDDETAKLVGVPLLGDVFLEGQAQAVQWLTDGTDSPLEERFSSRTVDPRPEAGAKKDIYYTAVARLIAATLPGWNRLHTTILLCDVALCSRTPAKAFVAAYRYLSSIDPVPVNRLADLRRHIAAEAYEKEGRTFIGEELAKVGSNFENATLGSAAALMHRLNDLMVRSWAARNRDPAYFLDLRYGNDWVRRVVQAIGAPPVFLDDIHHARTLTDHAEITKACFWSRGCFDLLNAVVADGFRKECPLLRTRICDWHKETVCQEGDLLNAPVRGGQGCHMAFAADSLELYARSWRAR